MKRTAILTALPLVCTAASSPAAFVYPAATATAAAPSPGTFTTNRPRSSGDVSSPLVPLQSYHHQQQQQQRQEYKRDGQRNRVVASLGGSAPAVASALASSTSFVVSWSPAALATLAGVLVGASVVNALQGGVRGDLGSTPEKILGVPAEEATAEDVAKLGKAGFMQLFYASSAAGDLDGEYRARTLDMGILHPITSVITHRIWGPGRWLGKGIRAGSSEGYNLFTSPSPSKKQNTPPSSSSEQAASSVSGDGGGSGSGLPSDMRRDRTFRFSPYSPSVFDRGASSKLNYAKPGKNGLLFGGMRDEVRKVNEQLFVGLGYIQAFGGKYNTAPFVMEGPPAQSFSGPDGGSK